jgi:TonB-linked SusC/RagA family outer membrane protein
MRERFNRTTSNAYLKYQIIDNLSLQLDGGVDYYNRQYDEFKNNILEKNAWGTQSSVSPLTLMGKAILDYGLTVKEKNKFKFMAGSEVLSNNTKKDESQSVTYPDTIPGEPFYQDPTIPADVKNSQDYTQTFGITGLQYGFISFFGRVLYTYNDRYLVNLTFRRDGSSRFGENNKWGSFPAASFGWIMTEEDFLKDVKWLNYLKVKVGFGKTGNAEIPNDAQFSKIVINDPKKYDQEGIRYITQLPNPDLRWETTNSWDAGIEFGIFKDRVSGAIDVYRKNTKDLFLNASVPASSGFTSVLINVGELYNQGIEFSFNSTNIKTQKFSWTTNFNIAYNEGEVTNTGGAGPDAFASTGDVRVLEGYPVGVNYIVKELGVDPETGAPIYEGIEKDENGNIIRRFETFTYSTDYRQPLGKPRPDWVGGFNNGFTYGRFDGNLNFIFQVGGNIYDDSEKYQLNAIGNWNLRKDVLDRWQQPGDESDVPRMTLNADVPNRNTSRYLHDASFVRLKNLSVGYTFPANTIKGINKLRIALTGTNLLTWTKYPGMDPEIFRDMENKQERNLSANVTYLTPPQARTFSLSLNLDF